MSIAPGHKEDEGFKPKLASRITYSTKKTAGQFFANPAKYLFWITTTGIIFNLFFNNSVAWQLYFFSFLFGLITIWTKKD